MTRFIGYFAVVVILLSTSAFAMDAAVIELNDGSVVHGRIVSFKNGRYTIETGSLGRMTISQEKVRSITSEGGPRSTSAKSTAGPEVGDVMKEMQGNEEIMALVRALQDDPEMQALIEDPAVMNAIASGDLSTLMSNPQIMKLMENPKVKEIQKKMAK